MTVSHPLQPPGGTGPRGRAFRWPGWGVGLTLHYLYRVRWVDKTISGRQAQIERRAAAGKRAA
jgi:hypothetical protein